MDAKREPISVPTMIAKMASLRFISVALGAAILFWGTDRGALAQVSGEDRIRVVQQRPFLRDGRFELSPFWGLTINDALVRHWMMGANATYHITEVLAVGAHFAYALDEFTPVFEQINSDFKHVPTSGDPQNVYRTNGLVPKPIPFVMTVSGFFQYVPLYGKFALFNSFVVHFDTYLLLGLGATMTKAACDPWHITPSVGVGQRFFITQWLSFNVEVRDFFYPQNIDFETLCEEGVEHDTKWVNNTVVSLGVSFFLPPSFTYKYLK